MNEFTKRYKKLNTLKLLKILEHPENYQKIAVKAAQEELAKRELIEEEIKAVKNEIKLEEDNKQERQLKIQEIKKKGYQLLESWNLVKNQKPSLNFKIYGIGILFTFSTILHFILNFDYYQYLIWESDSDLDFFTTLTILIYLPVLLACLFFLKKKTIGWILFFFQTTFSLVVNFSASIKAVTYNHA